MEKVVKMDRDMTKVKVVIGLKIKSKNFNMTVYVDHMNSSVTVAFSHLHSI